VRSRCPSRVSPLRGLDALVSCTCLS
jgi:hypothetical protein